MTNILNRLKSDRSMMSVLLQFEQFLDDMDVYVYANWIDGELADGPNISRYYATATFRFPYDRMPDPRGGDRLLVHDVRVEYRKHTETYTEAEPGMTPVKKTRPVWLVTIALPKKFIDELDNSDLAWYSDEIDKNSVQDARRDEAGGDV